MSRRPPVIINMPGGSRRKFTGRNAWALQRLIEAGNRGLTTLENPAPRWSQYIFRLRQAGLVISTEYERHDGPFPGNHGRYRLETPVTVFAEFAA